MIALGVCYTAFDEARAFADVLSELIRRALVAKECRRDKVFEHKELTL